MGCMNMGQFTVPTAGVRYLWAQCGTELARVTVHTATLII